MSKLYLKALAIFVTIMFGLVTPEVKAISQNPNLVLTSIDTNVNLNFNQNKAPGENFETKISKPVFKGTAVAGVIVTVTEGNSNVLCSTTTESNKSWECRSTKDLYVGEYKVTVTGKFSNSTDLFPLPYFNLKVASAAPTVSQEEPTTITTTQPTQSVTTTPTVTSVQESAQFSLPMILVAVAGVLVVFGIGVYIFVRRK